MNVRNESDVILACLCIETPQGRVKEGLLGKDEQLCPKGHGWQPILKTKDGPREATLYERFRWYEYGISAAKRRGKSSPSTMHDMPGGAKNKASRTRPEDSVLF